MNMLQNLLHKPSKVRKHIHDEQDTCAIWHATCAVTRAMNTNMMEAGVSPYQAVFGRVPRQLTSLVNNPGALAAHDAVNMDADASIAESARAAALKAFYELDCDRALRTAMTRGPTGGSHRPLQPGDVIDFFREAITNTTSKVQQKLTGSEMGAAVHYPVEPHHSP